MSAILHTDPEDRGSELLAPVTSPQRLPPFNNGVGGTPGFDWDTPPSALLAHNELWGLNMYDGDTISYTSNYDRNLLFPNSSAAGTAQLEPMNFDLDSDWTSDEGLILPHTNTLSGSIGSGNGCEDIDEFLEIMFATEMIPLRCDERLNRIPPSLHTTDNKYSSRTLTPNTIRSSSIRDSPNCQKWKVFEPEVNSMTFNVAPSPLRYHNRDSVIVQTDSRGKLLDTALDKSSIKSSITNSECIPSEVSRSLETGNQELHELGYEVMAIPRSQTKFLQSGKATRDSKRSMHRFDPRAFSFHKAIGKFQSTDTSTRKSYSADRRREVAKRRDIGACFTCRLWKVTVCLHTSS